MRWVGRVGESTEDERGEDVAYSFVMFVEFGESDSERDGLEWFVRLGDDGGSGGEQPSLVGRGGCDGKTHLDEFVGR